MLAMLTLIMLHLQGGGIRLWAPKSGKVQDPDTPLDAILAYQMKHKDCVPVHIAAYTVDGTPSEPIQFTVATLTGKSIPITLHPYATVLELKETIQDKEGIPPDQQRLILSGKQLEDVRTLADCNVKQGSKMSLTLRLRGGMMHETSGR